MISTVVSIFWDVVTTCPRRTLMASLPAARVNSRMSLVPIPQTDKVSPPISVSLLGWYLRVYSRATNAPALTWSQPASLDPSSTVPWTPRIPASSNCVTYSSEQLYGSNTASVSASASSPASVPGSSLTASQASVSGATGAAASGSKSGSTTGTAAGSSSTNGAGRLVASSALFALLGAVVMLL